MAAKPIFFCFFFVFFFVTRVSEAGGGQWALLKQSVGISAMHMQLLNNDRVIMYDRTDFGASKLALPKGKCRDDPKDLLLKHDCTAHSAEYNVLTNSIRPLFVQTNIWCSSGALSADGHLIQTGGFNDGERVVRIFRPCDGCDWVENGFGLRVPRWYATNQILPDGRIIIIGGRLQFNYEFYPKSESTNRVFFLPFLQQTSDPDENNLYPYVYLNVDGNLFIFANDRAILFDYNKNIVVKNFPAIPGGQPRNYPSTGSSVLLPLKNIHDPFVTVDVLICGGAPRGAFREATSGNFVRGLASCGRIRITDPNPRWSMETMPMARLMGDMILLPNGHVLIINGAARGTAGWELGRQAVHHPVIYRPDNPLGSRFEVQNPSAIPRVYHSSAILLRDGRILVGGSNPHAFYNFTGVLYPTELSLEEFSPDYVGSGFRPKIISPASQTKLRYGQQLIVRFSVPIAVKENGLRVTMVSPTFTTHSFSMNQRLLDLGGKYVKAVTNFVHDVAVMTPSSAVIAPHGYYLLFVVHQDIPSEGIWIHIQ